MKHCICICIYHSHLVGVFLITLLIKTQKARTPCQWSLKLNYIAETLQFFSSRISTPKNSNASISRFIFQRCRKIAFRVSQTVEPFNKFISVAKVIIHHFSWWSGIWLPGNSQWEGAKSWRLRMSAASCGEGLWNVSQKVINHAKGSV